jgi:hypothetical protein
MTPNHFAAEHLEPRSWHLQPDEPERFPDADEMSEANDEEFDDEEDENEEEEGEEELEEE